MSDDRTVVAETVGDEAVVAWPLIFRQRLARSRGGERSQWVVLWTVLAGLFSTGFSITILAVSLGTVARDLDADTTLLTWAVTGPLLALALTMPLFGKLGDLHGHRRVYLIGLTGFAVATALTAFAWSGTSLVAIRILGAIVGAATGPTSMAIIMRTFALEDRVKAMGWWSLVGAGAPVIGLVVGGPVVDAIGWRGIFLIQAPLAGIAVLAAFVVLKETPRGAREPIDWAGAATLAVATISLLLALNLGGDVGWGSAVVIGFFVLAPLAFVVFVRIERRVSHPLVPLWLFERRAFNAALVAQYCANFAYMGGFIVTPALVQGVFGFSVASASLAMVCRPLTFSISAPAAGYIAVRVGERRSSVVGIALLVVSMGCFAVAATGEVLALVFVGLVLSGLAMGAAVPSLVTEAANTIEPERLGLGNAVQQMVAQIGAVTGIQVLSTVQQSAGFGWAYGAGAVLAAFGLVAACAVPARAGRADLRVAAGCVIATR